MIRRILVISYLICAAERIAAHDIEAVAVATPAAANAALFRAIRANDASKVKSILDANPGIDINETERENTPRGWFLPGSQMPIELAAKRGNSEIIQALVLHGADINNVLEAKNPDEQEQILDNLIKAHINLNLKNPSTGWTPLIAATVRSQPYLVERLLSLPEVDPTIKDRQNNTYKDYAKIEKWHNWETKQAKQEIQKIIVAHEKRMKEQAVQQVATQTSTVASSGTFTQSLFSPRDNIKEKLIELIDAEAESISIAIYTFTLQSIANALERAAARGVKVRVISDASQTHGSIAQWQLLQRLLAQGVSVYLWPSVPIENAIMHNKFIIFGSTSPSSASLVWTGSPNLTYWASELHKENVLITSNPEMLEAYREQFEQIQRESRKISAR